MNKRERVMMAIRGEKPDRVPSALWYHFAEGCERGEAALKAHLDFFEHSATDICKVMNENSCPDDPTIQVPQDWGNLKPFSMDEDFITAQIDLVREVVDHVNGEAVVLATVHGLVASAYHILGGTSLYDADDMILTRHLRENPVGFSHALRIITDYLKELCQLCLKAGADGIYFASLGGTRSMFTDEEYATYIAPYEIEVMESIGQVPAFNILHMCKADLNLKRYLDYPATVLNWGVYEDNISLEEGRALFGEDKIYLGGLDDRAGVIVDGTIEEIEATVQGLVRDFGWKNYILGADCTLPTDIDNDRLRAATLAATID